MDKPSPLRIVFRFQGFIIEFKFNTSITITVTYSKSILYIPNAEKSAFPCLFAFIRRSTLLIEFKVFFISVQFIKVYYV